MFPTPDFVRRLSGDLQRDLFAFLPELLLCTTIVLMLLARLVPGLSRVHMAWKEAQAHCTEVKVLCEYAQQLLTAICGDGPSAYADCRPSPLQPSHSRQRRMLLKINDLSHSAFVNIKPIESTTYAFYAIRNAASFELSC